MASYTIIPPPNTYFQCIAVDEATVKASTVATTKVDISTLSASYDVDKTLVTTTIHDDDDQRQFTGIPCKPVAGDVTIILHVPTIITDESLITTLTNTVKACVMGICGTLQHALFTTAGFTIMKENIALAIIKARYEISGENQKLAKQNCMKWLHEYERKLEKIYTDMRLASDSRLDKQKMVTKDRLKLEKIINNENHRYKCSYVLCRSCCNNKKENKCKDLCEVCKIGGDMIEFSMLLINTIEIKTSDTLIVMLHKVIKLVVKKMHSSTMINIDDMKFMVQRTQYAMKKSFKKIHDILYDPDPTLYSSDREY